MQIIRTSADLAQFRREHTGKKIGFVPTMGNLHDGHMSLVVLAKQHADIVIVSTYVNPTQFGVGEDFDAYPRTFEADKHTCEQHGVSAMFVPTTDVIYPSGVEHAPVIDMPDLMRRLCAKTRPTHFQGMASVVLKLFQLVRPDIAVFCEKDFQQLAIIRRLVTEFFLDIEIIDAPIIRELDGLAMSSRNQYLDADERERAGKVNVLLSELRRELLSGTQYETAMTNTHRQFDELGQVDYLELIDKNTLVPTTDTINSVIVTAVKIGKTRLLDNLVV